MLLNGNDISEIQVVKTHLYTQFHIKH